MPRKKPLDPKTYAEQIGARIRRFREKKGLPQSSVAIRAGIATASWCDYEKGRQMPLNRLPAVARALGCKPRALLPP
jgi:transcriptional regulator with XRE-family HTH domain